MLPPKAPAPIQNRPSTPLNQVPTPDTRRTGAARENTAPSRKQQHGAPSAAFRTARATSSAKRALDRPSSAGAQDEAGERLPRPEPRQHIDPWQTMTRRVGHPRNGMADRTTGTPS